MTDDEPEMVLFCTKRTHVALSGYYSEHFSAVRKPKLVQISFCDNIITMFDVETDYDVSNH